MHYVYILCSSNDNTQTYIGCTKDLKARLYVHNSGGSKHTSKYRPWVIAWYCAFRTMEDARSFEKYLKSGSGKAFTRRHLGVKGE